MPLNKSARTLLLIKTMAVPLHPSLDLQADQDANNRQQSGDDCRQHFR
jgi:hypothetical protein